LIEGFGGHAMAAGLGLARDALADFRAAFTAEVERLLGGLPGHREILTDGPLAAGEMTLGTAQALREAAPWGAGFPPPSFDGVFTVRSHDVIAGLHLKMRVVPEAGAGTELDAIAFNAEPALRDNPGTCVRLVYRLEVNEFRGRRTVQLVIEHIESEDPVQADETGMTESDTLRG